METIGVDYSVGDEVWVLDSEFNPHKYLSRPKLFKTTITKRQIVLTTSGLNSDLEVYYWAGDTLLSPEDIFPTQEAAEKTLINRALELGRLHG